MAEIVSDLLAFLDASPTPYHAVAESAERLEAAGYRRLREQDTWDLGPGDRGYVVRGGGSLIAFELGADDAGDAGFRMIGAHTDSPCLRLKPRADLKAHGYRQLGVEPYGGLLLHTWLDRDLGLAGRVSLGARSGSPAEPRSLLVDLRRPLARIPNLAIHLYRELRQDGLKLNEQTHLVPVIGLDSGADLAALLAEEVAAVSGDDEADDILAFDLMLYDLQGAAVGGAGDEFVFSARLDNLASTHAALSALIAAGDGGESEFTRVVALYDHEEVGSRSAQGAQGTLLLDVLDRLAAIGGSGDTENRIRALARSWLVSADMAHAVHPNYADRHEAAHRPALGGGPVIKVNAGQSYASDGESAAMFAAICRRLNVPYQHFVARSDLGCGSTIGPITASRLGVRTVDVGNPMLSMHSCREMAGSADVEPMIRVLAAYLTGA